MITIGDRIRWSRQAKEMTLAQLAEAIGLASPQAMWQVENGRRDPRASQLLMLGHVLDVDPAWLLIGGEGIIPAAVVGLARKRVGLLRDTLEAMLVKLEEASV